MENLTLFITAWLYYLCSTKLPRQTSDQQGILVSCMGMSGSTPSVGFSWKVKEMSNTGTKGRPNGRPVDS
jgi:hypothetical protein